MIILTNKAIAALSLLNFLVLNVHLELSRGDTMSLFPLLALLLQHLVLPDEERDADAAKDDAPEDPQQLLGLVEASLVEDDESRANPERHARRLVDRHDLQLVIVLHRLVEHVHLGHAREGDRDHHDQIEHDVGAQLFGLAQLGQQFAHDDCDA